MATPDGSARRRGAGTAVAMGTTGVAALAGLLVAGDASAAQAAPRTPVCVPAMLRIVDAGSQGAAGTIYHLLRFTNVTRTSCVMHGYPGVSFTDARGRQLGVPAARDAAVPVARVVLRPGRSAHAAVGIPDPGNFPAPSCHPRTSTYLRVYPPGSYTSRLVPLPASVCTTTFGRTHVQSVAAGPGTP